MSLIRNKITEYRICRTIRRSGLFDREYYLRNNLDVARNCMDPVRHYALYGWREGRNPSARFDTRWYLNRYPDVALQQMNPLYHYCRFGCQEGRMVSEDAGVNGGSHPSGAIANTRWALFTYLLGMIVKHPLTTLKLLSMRRLKFMLLTLRGSHEEPSRLQVRYRDIYENYTRRTAAIGGAGGHAQRSDIFIFPIIDWHFRIQRPQHLAMHLARLGYRVFYFTTVPKLHDDGHPFEIIEQVQERVFLCKLYADGSEQNIYRDTMTESVAGGYRKSILALMNAMGTKSSVSIIHLPYWLPLAKSIPGSQVVYDCMDHHEGFHGDSAEMSSMEMQAVQESEVVITTSEYLYRNVSRWRPTTIVRNGTEFEKFAQAPGRPRSARRKQQVVGYIGAISEWFDVDLVAQAASRYPQYQFVLVGSTAGCNTAPLKTVPNVKLVGEVPYGEVAGRLHDFDITIIPFKINELTKATNPVKVYEYLSAGKPVVATAMPELCLLAEHIHIGHSREEFLDKIGLAMKECGDLKLAERRRDWARTQDWAVRARAFEKAIEQSMPRVSIVILAYNNLEFTRNCLESIERNTYYPNYEVIVVDNASQDDTAEYVAEYIAGRPNYSLICNRENLGFSAGNNVGIRKATGEYIVLLNNDTYAAPGWLQNLIWPLMRDKTIGLAGPITNNIGNEAKINIAYRDMREMEAESFKYIQAHRGQLLWLETVAFFCVAIPRRIIEEVGELDEQFRMGFFEDDDYCRRVRLAGYRIVVVEDSFVHHHLSASFNQLGQERQRIFEENKRVYEKKWGRWQRHVYREESDRVQSESSLPR